MVFISRLSVDPEPTVRVELMERIPELARICIDRSLGFEKLCVHLKIGKIPYSKYVQNIIFGNKIDQFSIYYF